MIATATTTRIGTLDAHPGNWDTPCQTLKEVWNVMRDHLAELERLGVEAIND